MKILYFSISIFTNVWYYLSWSAIKCYYLNLYPIFIPCHFLARPTQLKSNIFFDNTNNKLTSLEATLVRNYDPLADGGEV